MSNIDKLALREAAEKATKGEWAVWFDDEVYSTNGVENQQIAIAFSKNDMRDAEFIAAANPSTVLALLDELEAKDQLNAELSQKAEIYDMLRQDYELQGSLVDFVDWQAKRIAELTESLKQTVSGYKSCLRTGHDRILDLGGDCDEPEVMIAGNPDIQQAEKLIAAAAGKGEA